MTGTLAERQRYVRVAAAAINEELRVGLIDSKEALRKLRELHKEAGWPFAGIRPTQQEQERERQRKLQTNGERFNPKP